MAPRIEFYWDEAKASSNAAKHGVAFEEVLAVFSDPLALSIPDTESAAEERWVTIGERPDGRSFVVVHTHRETDAGVSAIRIISARRPTKAELKTYRESEHE